MSRLRPALSALGIVNALGNNKAEVHTNFLASHAPGITSQSEWLPGTAVGEVNACLPTVPVELSEFNCRNNRLLLAALEQIEDEVQRCIKQYGHQRLGIVVGSSTSGILEGEQAVAHSLTSQNLPAEFNYRQQEIGTPALFLAQLLNLSAPAYTISTACSSSAKAFASARNLLALDLCDAVIVGGADSLCQLTLRGFNALESVSKERCNPFSQNRDGITIGEAAALFVMEKQAQAGAIQLLGAGASADAHHVSAPHPEGRGAAAAMQAALKDAQLKPEDIRYINLHGTATPKNDAMESIAVNQVLGPSTLCSSTKPLTGHTLGAAGATELGLCWLLLANSSDLPAQVSDGERDPSLAPINLVFKTTALATGDDAVALMSNSFAFGGSNASVIIGRGFST